MAGTVERFRTVAEGCAQRIDGIAPDQWTAETPCDRWTVEELVDHLIGGLDMMLGAVGQTVPDDPDADAATRFRTRADAIAAAMEDPALASTPMPGPAGEVAFKQMAGGVMLHDALVHTWDLARATGQDDRLDHEIVAVVHQKMLPFDDYLREPNMFGPKLEPAPDADEQARFLAFVGRG